MPFLASRYVRFGEHAILAVIFGVAASASEAPEGLLRGVVVDAESKAPLPCRLYIRGIDGVWHFPSSVGLEGSTVIYNKRSLSDPSIAEVHATLSPHPSQVALPPGRYTITAERGKEYHPWTKQVEIGRTGLNLTIALRRWCDMAALGWYSGESHVHRPLSELPNLMLAEDLNIAFPLEDWVREADVAPTARRSSTYVDPGQGPIKVDATHWIYPRNTEYELFTVGGQAHTLGAFFVIHHKTPLDLGAPPVRPVAQRAHAEGALIELDKHNWPWSMALVPIMPVDLYELANNHVWRTQFGFPDFGEPAAAYMKIERDDHGFTERGWIDFGFQNYYALLNCGFRLRPTAGTASGVHPVPLGFGRVYVHLRPDEPFDGSAWLDGLNAGRGFVTTGPMLRVTINGQDPGSMLHQDRCRLQGSALSAVPLRSIEVVINGEVVRSIRPDNHKTDQGAYESVLDETLPIDGTSWVAVRCFEDRADGRVRFAHTAPFHLEVPGRPLRPRKEEVDYLIERVQKQLGRSQGVLNPPALDEYREALRIYETIRATAR